MHLISTPIAIGFYKLLSVVGLRLPSFVSFTISTPQIMTDFEGAWTQKWTQRFGCLLAGPIANSLVRYLGGNLCLSLPGDSNLAPQPSEFAVYAHNRRSRCALASINRKIKGDELTNRYSHAVARSSLHEYGRRHSILKEYSSGGS
jgi:hypothetical protein